MLKPTDPRITLGITLKFDFEEAQRLLNQNQLQALFRGIAEVLAAKTQAGGEEKP